MNRSNAWFPGFLRLGIIIFMLLMLILFHTPQYVYSAEVTLAWDAVMGCDDLAGYRIYKTNQEGLYTYGQFSAQKVWQGPGTNCTVSVDDEECWFVVTAFDGAGNESGPSNEQDWQLPDNIQPIALAGSDQTVNEDETVTLDGSNAYDPDGIIESYEWTQTTGTFAMLSDPTSVTPTFTAPSVGVGGEALTFQLTATDDGGLSDTDAVIINVSSEADPPVPVPSWTDYRMTLTMRSNDNDAIGVMFRYHDNDNYYRFSWYSQHDYRRLVKRVNGEFVLLAEDSASYVPGESFQIEVVADGTTLQIWIDGSPVFYVEDESISEGTIAFYSWANKGSYFDDVYVEHLATGTVLLYEDFDDGDLSDWTIVDEGAKYAPSAWSVATGALVQRSNIHSLYGSKLAMLGTFALYLN